MAYELGVGFVPIRKKGKLPFTTVQETYELGGSQRLRQAGLPLFTLLSFEGH